MVYKKDISSLAYFPDPAGNTLPAALGKTAAGEQRVATNVQLSKMIDGILAGYHRISGMTGAAAYGAMLHESGLGRLMDGSNNEDPPRRGRDFQIIEVDGHERLAFWNGSDYSHTQSPSEIDFSGIQQRLVAVENQIAEAFEGVSGGVTQAELSTAVTNALNEIRDGVTPTEDTLAEISTVVQAIAARLQILEDTPSGATDFTGQELINSFSSGDLIPVLGANKAVRGLAAPALLTGTPTAASAGGFVVPELVQDDPTAAESNTTILRNFMDKQVEVVTGQYDPRAIILPQGKGAFIKPGNRLFSRTNLNGFGMFQSLLRLETPSTQDLDNVFTNRPGEAYDKNAATQATDIVGYTLEDFGIIGWDELTGSAQLPLGSGININNTIQSMIGQYPELNNSLVDALGRVRRLLIGFLPGRPIHWGGRGENHCHENFSIRTRGGAALVDGFDNWVQGNTFSDTGTDGLLWGWSSSRLYFNKTFWNGKHIPATIDEASRWYGIRYMPGVERSLDVGNEAQDCAGGGHFITGWHHDIKGSMADVVGQDWHTGRYGTGPNYAGNGVKTSYVTFENTQFTTFQGRGMNFLQQGGSRPFATDHYVQIRNDVTGSVDIEMNVSEKRAPDWNGPYVKRVVDDEVGYAGNGALSGARVRINGSTHHDGLDGVSIANLQSAAHDVNRYRKDTATIRSISDNGRYVLPAGGGVTDVWRYIDDGTVVATPV